MRFIPTLLIALLVLACTSEEREETREYTFEADARIVPPQPDALVSIATVETGDKLVFRYAFEIPSDPNIADSGFSEVLLFEISPGLTEFEVSGAELAQLNAYYRQICFCATNDSYPVTGGRISGQRRSETAWEIDIDVDLEYAFAPVELQVSGTFRKQ